ncbi:MAG TPA: sulfate adenylyltransferase [Longimicrobiales bacterium]|nr:sulfate adenylyltransferase [Longimicrobiales bacterium]
MGSSNGSTVAREIHWHEGHVTRGERERAQGHRGATLWLTGLSGSGKSTLARALEVELFRRGYRVYVLDGDNIRHGLNRDLGFGPEARTENIRRIGEVAKLFTDFGAIVITAFISPYRADRDSVRALMGKGDFIEIFVDAPLETCEARDPKGLYKKARRGEIPEFTGISAPYEPPTSPELVVNTANHTLEESVAQVLAYLESEAGVIGSAGDPSGSGIIPPYGGVLVDRVLRGEGAAQARARAASLKSISVPSHVLSDLYLIAVGALSPLEGFMGSADYEAVLTRTTLANGLPWSVPITLAAHSSDVADVKPGDEVALTAPDGQLAGILHVRERFSWDPDREAQAVFGTTDRAHPGVARLYDAGDILLAGPIDYLYEGDISGFPELNLTPAEVRAEIERRGWKTVVGFQTRNPVHRAHEYLQKCAMETVDGLLLHPLVGDTKSDDVPADVRVECYRVLLERYYPQDRVLLAVLPAAMRYAGPKEAIHHAIMRRNYGCSHFIVGRDHAGVGNYYGTYDAQLIFDKLDGDALGIQPLKFEHSFYCRACEQMVTAKTCPHGKDQHVFLSGTQVRAYLSEGRRPPAEFTRPEVADVLMRAYATASNT